MHFSISSLEKLRLKDQPLILQKFEDMLKLSYHHYLYSQAIVNILQTFPQLILSFEFHFLCGVSTR